MAVAAQAAGAVRGLTPRRQLRFGPAGARHPQRRSRRGPVGVPGVIARGGG
ncbi:hypothetical protein ACFPM0_00770 [Pseudonocardia sulfidoxydans]|uniref:hypothetical protein n=1 Tax=Pseudonocardia sulfidoxydans TaxID=54011 RepID=UPI0036228C2A